jgi:Uma2 family endonuclease
MRIAAYKLASMSSGQALRAGSHRHLSLKEWGDLPDDVRAELVDGSLVEEEMPSEAHELAVSWCIIALGQWLISHGGRVTGSESKYAVSGRRGRKPDVSVFLPGSRRPRGSDRVITFPPDVAIEVITATPRDTRRDRIDKARDYAKFGVRWYWLIDPAVRTVEIFELDTKGRYVQVVTASEGRIKVPSCRGLTIDLNALWRYVGASED